MIQPPAGSAEAKALRLQLGLGNEPFQAVLVGKDGGAKLRAAKPISALELMATIDAMPMRQEEMRRRALAIGAEPCMAPISSDLQ